VLVGGQSNVAADDKRNVFRLVLAWWDCKSNTPLQTNGATLGGSIEHGQASALGLISVVYDKMYSLASPGRDSTGYLPPTKLINLHKKLSGKINYTGNGVGTANRHLILSMISDSGIIPSPGFVTGEYCFKYLDL